MDASESGSTHTSVEAGGAATAIGETRTRPVQARAWLSWLDRHALFVGSLALIAAVLLLDAPSDMHQDAWLALVAGRVVAHFGIPHHDTLAVLTHGTRWIDQQWLAQLAIYGLYQLGGLSLYSIAYVALTVGGCGMAIAAARALGGTEAHVVRVLPITALYFAGSLEIRGQGFAYPLFVATLWLLAAEVRGATRGRVYLVLPLLVLWGNLHGSAVLGAGLIVVYGASLLIEDLRNGRGRELRRRGPALIIAAPLCLLVTPYGLSGLAYYQETLLNPTFKALVSEWQPITTSAVLAVPFFAAAFATVWMIGYSRGRAGLFGTLTLLLLIAGAISAVRNITWFALSATVLLPPMLSASLISHPPATRRRRLNIGLVATSVTVLLVCLIAVAIKPGSWFERDYDPKVLSTVASVVRSEPSTHVFAGPRFADWLLWRKPALAGHIAYDVRFELLTASQLREITELTQIRAPKARDLLAGYRLLVLERNEASKLLLAQPGTRVLLRGRGVTVAARPGNGP